jgi:two-component system, cell cycle sensor histidine kinase and response regulator CckA
MTLQACSSGREPVPGRTILLVEDEPFVRDATRRILQNAGFQVVSAADAREALAAYDQAGASIDLLMTDVVLPGRSGFQLVQDLRLRSSSTAILMTSGYGDSRTESDSSDSGTHYLPKPYCRQSLLEKIEQIFSDSSFEGAATQAS